MKAGSSLRPSGAMSPRGDRSGFPPGVRTLMMRSVAGPGLGGELEELDGVGGPGVVLAVEVEESGHAAAAVLEADPLGWQVHQRSGFPWGTSSGCRRTPWPGGR